MFKHQVILGVFALLPSLLLCWAILSTFYRTSIAYLAISWVPAVLYFAIVMFRNEPGQILNSYDLDLLLESVVWTSLCQAAIGIGLLIRVIFKGEDWIMLAIATLVAGVPFIVDKI